MRNVFIVLAQRQFQFPLRRTVEVEADFPLGFSIYRLRGRSARPKAPGNLLRSPP
jgi:hypothetical protein